MEWCKISAHIIPSIYTVRIAACMRHCFLNLIFVCVFCNMTIHKRWLFNQSCMHECAHYKNSNKFELLWKQVILSTVTITSTFQWYNNINNERKVTHSWNRYLAINGLHSVYVMRLSWYRLLITSPTVHVPTTATGTGVTIMTYVLSLDILAGHTSVAVSIIPTCALCTQCTEISATFTLVVAWSSCFTIGSNLWCI